MADGKNPAHEPSEVPREPDFEIGELVTHYMDVLNDGGRVEAARVLLEHPDLGEDVLEQLRMFLELDANVEATISSRLGSFGDFTLRRQVGRGGMGIVYEAWENSMDRPVALKVLPAAIAADDRAVTRFVREARVAGRLHHPNIVAVYGMGVTEQVPYFSMEYVEGETLAQILARQSGAAAETETVFGRKDRAAYFEKLAEGFAHVADGLQHAHSSGVVHRDIKPSNLIRDTDGQLRILDFGLARLEGQATLTLSGDIVGTPLYMSPEQARRHRVAIDHRTDVYSLGATMYEVFTGRPPFTGRDYEDTLSQIIQREPAGLRKLNARVPTPLETIIMKCLRKDPSSRYGTAEALAQDLERFLRGDPVEARREKHMETLARHAKRYRLQLLAATVSALIVVVALAAHSRSIAEERNRFRSERDRAEHHLYVAYVNLAERDWENGNLARFTQLLEAQEPQEGRPDRRGWEWYHLGALPDTGLHRAVSGDVVTWSPDGQQLLTTRPDGVENEIALWHLESGREVHRFDHGGMVNLARFSPDGSRFVSSSWRPDGHVRIWDPESHSLLAELTPDFGEKVRSSVYDIAWHPQRDWLAVSGPGEIQIWDVSDPDRIEKLASVSPAEWRRKNHALSVAWRRDGQRLAMLSQSGGLLLILESGSWERLASWPAHDRGCCVVWSPDGQRLATSGSGRSGRTLVGETKTWDAESGEEVDRLVSIEGANRIAWSPDGTLLALTLHDSAVQVLDPDSLQVLDTYRGHSDSAWQCAWQPQPGSPLLATAGRGGTTRIWDTDISQEALAVEVEGATGAAWSLDGESVLVLSDAGPLLTEIDVRTGETTEKATLAKEGFLVSASLVPDGEHLALGTTSPRGTSVSVWDWRRNEMLWSTLESKSRAVSALDWSPDGEWLVIAANTSSPRLRDGQTGEELALLEGHESWVISVAWSPDGERVATASSYQSVRIWKQDAAGKWISSTPLELFDPRVFGKRCPMAWSPDSARLAIGTAPGDLFVADVREETIAHQVAAHSLAVNSIAWSGDGRRLATGSADRTVKIWDADSPDQLLVLRLGDEPVRQVEWSPDCRRLLAVGMDRTVKIWTAPGYPAPEERAPSPESDWRSE